MKVFAKTPALPGSSAPVSANAVAPAQSPAAEVGPAAPPASAAMPVLATSVPESIANPPGPNWSYTQRWQSTPIVVNQFPIDGSFAPWSPEDQYQLSKWNYYGDIFRVYVTPTGTYLWGDGVNDLAGWLTDAEAFSMYGSHLACGTGCQVLAVTFKRWNNGGWILEGDIVMNAAIAWTLDDEWAWDGGAATTFRQSMIHEMGHLHGLEHNFTSLALMNYFNPSKWRFFAMPFGDDTMAIRGGYPSNAVARTDLAVYLYYYNGPPVCYDGTNFNNCITEATYPSSVIAGASLTVNNYHVENVGTTTIATPTIVWYLTAARNFSSAYYYLGTSTYPSMDPNSFFTPSTVGRMFTVPAGVAAGNYYLAAYISSDGGAVQGSFPFSNNYGFSLNKISVAVLPSAPTIGIAIAGNASISVVFTPGALGSGYLINYTADCGGVTHTGYSSPITVSGLINGASYTCKVKTTTNVGTGPWSVNSNSVSPFMLPSAPTAVTATAGLASASINVAFTPGALGSGYLINYTADCGGVTHTGYSSPISVIGLINGTSYTCKVKTTANVGTSAWSVNSNAVTPFAPPTDGFPGGGAISAGWIQPSGSNAPWFVTSDTAYGGTFSLKSGHIVDSQRSDISYRANFSAGNVSFARKVSSELNYDFLQFYIDSVLQNSWSGELDWVVVSFPISAGTHTLLWRYVKDGSVSSGSDAAWIDRVQLPSNHLLLPLGAILMLLLD
jgi:hypothetical protein